MVSKLCCYINMENQIIGVFFPFDSQFSRTLIDALFILFTKYSVGNDWEGAENACDSSSKTVPLPLPLPEQLPPAAASGDVTLQIKSHLTLDHYH